MLGILPQHKNMSKRLLYKRWDSERAAGSCFQASRRRNGVGAVRAKRGTLAVPPLSRGINAVRPSLVSHCFPSFFYITRPSASTLSAICASLPGRPSPISLPRPCTRRFAGDRLRIDPSPSIPKSSHPLILVRLACPVGPKA